MPRNAFLVSSSILAIASFRLSDMLHVHVLERTAAMPLDSSDINRQIDELLEQFSLCGNVAKQHGRVADNAENPDLRTQLFADVSVKPCDFDCPLLGLGDE